MASKLDSDFPQLPGDDDSQRIAIYQAIYAQLDALGIQHPSIPAEQISRANMLRHLQLEAGKIVKQELQAAKYNGHTDQECADILNVSNPLGAFNAPPIHEILVGFPFLPNAVTALDVSGSKNNK